MALKELAMESYEAHPLSFLPLSFSFPSFLSSLFSASFHSLSSNSFSPAFVYTFIHVTDEYCWVLRGAEEFAYLRLI